MTHCIEIDTIDPAYYTGDGKRKRHAKQASICGTVSYRTACLTGELTPSEVLTLTWMQVDMRRGLIRMDPGITKGEEGRQFPITAALRKILKRREKASREDCPLVFHADGQPIHRRAFHKVWTAACEAAHRPHPVRHEAHCCQEFGTGRHPSQGSHADGRAPDGIYLPAIPHRRRGGHPRGRSEARPITTAIEERRARMNDAERFEKAGNNPLAWWYSADTLLRAAAPLLETTIPINTSFTTGLMDARSGVYGLLIGYAIECLLKARWLADGHQMVVNGRLEGPKGNHRLKELADAVGVSLNDRERDALDRLSAIVRFAARYPIATTAREMEMRQTHDGKTISARVFRREDFETVEEIARRLQIGPWPWGQMAPSGAVSTTDLLQLADAADTDDN